MNDAKDDDYTAGELKWFRRPLALSPRQAFEWTAILVPGMWLLLALCCTR